MLDVILAGAIVSGAVYLLYPLGLEKRVFLSGM